MNLVDHSRLKNIRLKKSRATCNDNNRVKMKWIFILNLRIKRRKDIKRKRNNSQTTYAHKYVRFEILEV